MKTSKCFINDLKELMRIHNYKDISVTANIEKGKLKIDELVAHDNDGNEVYALHNVL
jgi:hypothetical protein